MHIIVTPKTRLRDIFTKFTGSCEFLAIRFFPVTEMKQAKDTPHSMELVPLDYSKTLSECCSQEVDPEYEFLITMDTRTGTIEEEFLASFGIYAQVCYIDDERLWCSNAYTDEYRLEGFEEYLADQDCAPIREYIKARRGILGRKKPPKPRYPGLWGELDKHNTAV
ncbi:hypothetical protein LJC46_05925 [Desulfovibrio sp. OttesenSCG-928-G15]|nr:hypothetical protein [Desulfovibrio sp. OttesenSCG-928-G15]